MTRMSYAERLAANRSRLERGEVSPPHGSDSTYRNWGCRCSLCRDAHSAAIRDARARRKSLLATGNPSQIDHGNPWTYGNHGCRCDLCTTAWRDYAAARRVRAG